MCKYLCWGRTNKYSTGKEQPDTINNTLQRMHSFFSLQGLAPSPIIHLLYYTYKVYVTNKSPHLTQEQKCGRMQETGGKRKRENVWHCNN